MTWINFSDLPLLKILEDWFFQQTNRANFKVDFQNNFNDEDLIWVG
jgi:hypothetical protein